MGNELLFNQVMKNHSLKSLALDRLTQLKQPSYTTEFYVVE